MISGVLKVMRTEEDGRELLLYYIKKGENCIMSFLGGLHNDTSKVRAEVEEAVSYTHLIAILLYRGKEVLKKGNVWVIPIEKFLMKLVPGKFELEEFIGMRI